MAGSEILVLGPDHSVDLSTGVVHLGSEDRPLSRLEKRLLRALVESGGAVLSRQDVARVVWGSVAASKLRGVDNLVYRLRARVERDVRQPVYVQTVLGGGYRWATLDTPLAEAEVPSVAASTSAIVVLDACAVDLEERRFEGARAGTLTKLEAALLQALARAPGRSFSRLELARSVWGARSRDIRMVGAAVARLRSKVEIDPSRPRSLLSVRGMGVTLRLGGFEHAARVPQPGTSFVGRTGERAELVRLLQDSGIIALVGPPGVGKTRLASVVADEMSAGGSRSVVYVDLDVGPSEGAMIEALARGLQLGAVTGPEEIRRALRNRHRGLLVLDHADVAGEALAAWIPTWTDGATDLAVLLTTREALRLPSERVVRVDPLDRETSRALFRERGGRGIHDQALDELGGLPLAIELAASSSDVAATTLDAVISSSWNQLSTEERRACATLGLLHDRFGDDQVADILGDGWRPLLEPLVAKSFLQVEPDTARPYRVLPPIRAAAVRLWSEAEGDDSKLWAAVCTAFGAAGASAVRTLERVRTGWRSQSGDLDVAFDVALRRGWWAAAAGMALALTRRPTTPIARRVETLSQALAIVPESQERWRALLLFSRARAHGLRGEVDAAERDAEHGATLLERDDPAGQGWLADLRADVAYGRGDMRAASELLAVADAAYGRAGLMESALLARDGSVGHAMSCGLITAEQGIERLTACASSAREHELPWVLFIVLDELALLHWRTGNQDAAEDAWREAVGLASDPIAQAKVWGGLGLVHVSRGDFRGAITLFRAAYDCNFQYGRLERAVLNLGNLGQAQNDAGQKSAGRATLRKGIELARSLGLRRPAANFLVAQAREDLGTGQLEDAIARTGEALELLEGVDRTLWAEAGVVRAMALERSGDRMRAAEVLSAAEQALVELGLPEQAPLRTEAAGLRASWG